MKKHFKNLTLLLLFASTSIFAQEKNLISGKVLVGTKQFEIPAEVKSNKIFKLDSREFTMYKRFSESLKENVIVVTDSKNKIVCAYLPTSTPDPQARIFKCFQQGFWNHNGGTGWGGFWDCMFG